MADILGRQELLHASRDWPLHIKQPRKIDIDALLALPNSTPLRREHLRRALRWLGISPTPEPGDPDDLADDVYVGNFPPIDPDDLPKTRFTPDQMQQLIDAMSVLVDPLNAEEEEAVREILGGVNLFRHPEPYKIPPRNRVIKESFTANEQGGRDTLLGLHQCTKTEAIGMLHLGDFFWTADFKGYYDAFSYEERVRKYHCFRASVFTEPGVSQKTRTAVCRSHNLNMGHRPAGDVAQSTTDFLLDFVHTSASKSIIDNVAFVNSDPVALQSDADAFLDRVRAVGGELNDDDQIIVRKGAWAGLMLDFTNKTSALLEKTLEKFTLSWQRRGHWTWRQFAAHVGLLFWSLGILDVPIASYFDLLRFISRTSLMLQREPELWDTPASIPPVVMSVMDAWTKICLRNTPRKVPAPGATEWLVATDASGYGWGYIAYNVATGQTRAHGAPWTEGERARFGQKILRSTFTEPRALLNTARHLLPRHTGEPIRVRFGTDNTVAKFSLNRGFNSHNFDINDGLRQLEQDFGGSYLFEAVYLPGIINDEMADGLSRGKMRGADVDWAVARAQLQQELGDDATGREPGA